MWVMCARPSRVVFTDCPPGPLERYVDPQLVGRDLDVLLGRCLKHGDHIERGERGKSPLLRIERLIRTGRCTPRSALSEPVDVRASNR